MHVYRDLYDTRNPQSTIPRTHKVIVKQFLAAHSQWEFREVNRGCRGYQKGHRGHRGSQEVTGGHSTFQLGAFWEKHPLFWTDAFPSPLVTRYPPFG